MSLWHLIPAKQEKKNKRQLWLHLEYLSVAHKTSNKNSIKIKYGVYKMYLFIKVKVDAPKTKLFYLSIKKNVYSYRVVNFKIANHFYF